MRVQLLAVENQLTHYRNLVSILDSITKDDRRDWEIEGFDYHRVASAKEAITLLEGVKNRHYYDILVLDLSIPSKENGIEDTAHGFEVLEAARRLRATKQTVIYTQYKSDRNILKALRGGANDFVAKAQPGERDEQELQTRFMACWQRLLENESFSLLEERIKTLIPHAEAGLAQRFTSCFSNFLQKVAHTAEDVQHYAVARFGLDFEKDSQDYLIRSLKNQSNEIKGVTRHWASLNADLIQNDGKKLTPTALLPLLNHISQRWAPSFVVKKCRYQKSYEDSGSTKVLSFQNDAAIILQEIIAGTLYTLQDHGPRHELEVKIKIKDGQAAIQFIDDLGESITPEDARVINEGLILGPNHGPERFGRAWGLSVIQHLALRGGGRLIIEPRAKGSAITYFAPLQLNQN